MAPVKYLWKILGSWDRVPDLETGSRLLDLVLTNRGVSAPQQAAEFLCPDFIIRHDPFAFTQMDAAVQRILGAIRKGEKILIYGDYDVDGVTGTSILVQFLERLGAAVYYFIPDRVADGYGLNLESLGKAHKNGFNLVVTTDCGIASHDCALWLAERAVDLIVTDHHEPQGGAPRALAVLDPKVEHSGYPFRDLAGAGVALKLVEAMALTTGLGAEFAWSEFGPLAGLGAIADEVPLWDENLSLARQAINCLGRTDHIGITALRNACGLKDRDKLTAREIAFQISPRINAAGRIWNPRAGVELLTAKDPRRANQIAREMDRKNNDRKREQDKIRKDILSRFETSPPGQEEMIIVAASDEWHPGIIGIVASQIAERFSRPTLLLTSAFPQKSSEYVMLKGSGRTWGAFNLFEALTHCSEFLERFGGHAQAGGLTLRADSLSDFRAAINDYARKNRSQGLDMKPLITVEARIPPEALRIEEVERISELEPFGAGNPEPVFALGPAALENIRWVGENGRHLKAKIRLGNYEFDAIGFSFDPERLPDPNAPVELAAKLNINTFNNSTKVQLEIKDIRPSSGA